MILNGVQAREAFAISDSRWRGCVWGGNINVVVGHLLRRKSMFLYDLLLFERFADLVTLEVRENK